MKHNAEHSASYLLTKSTIEYTFAYIHMRICVHLHRHHAKYCRRHHASCGAVSYPVLPKYCTTQRIVHRNKVRAIEATMYTLHTPCAEPLQQTWRVYMQLNPDSTRNRTPLQSAPPILTILIPNRLPNNVSSLTRFPHYFPLRSQPSACALAALTPSATSPNPTIF